MKIGPIPAWLDEATAALVTETVNLRDLKESDTEILAKLWKDCEGVLAMRSTHFAR